MITGIHNITIKILTKVKTLTDLLVKTGIRITADQMPKKHMIIMKDPIEDKLIIIVQEHLSIIIVSIPIIHQLCLIHRIEILLKKTGTMNKIKIDTSISMNNNLK